jgi:hypothetical protein
MGALCIGTHSLVLLLLSWRSYPHLDEVRQDESWTMKRIRVAEVIKCSLSQEWSLQFEL